MKHTAYELARLSFASASEFLKIIKDVREVPAFVREAYSPTRDGVRAFHEAGDTHVFELATSDQRALLRELDDLRPHPSVTRRQTTARTNIEMLTTYQTSFSRPFRPLAGPGPGRFESWSARVGALEVTGKPHLVVRARNGRLKYVYLLTNDLLAHRDRDMFAALLAQIVKDNAPEAEYRDLELLDLRDGTRIVIESGLGVRRRKRIESVTTILRSVLPDE